MKNIVLRDKNGKIYFGWFIVLLGFLVMTLGYVPIVSLTGVFMIPVTTGLDISVGNFSIYLMIISIACLTVMSFMGRVIGKGNVKLIMLISAVLGAISFVGFGSANTLIAIYLWSIPMGITFGCLTATPSTLLINNWFGPKLRGIALSIAFGGSTMGGMIMIPTMNWIVQEFGWRVGYYLIAANFIVIVIPAVLLFAVKHPRDKGMTRIGDLEESEANKAKNEGFMFEEARRKPLTWLLFLSTALVVFSSSSILAHAQPYLIIQGFSTNASASIVSLMIGFLTIGSIVAGYYCDKVSLKQGAAGCAIIFAICFLGLAAMPTAKWLIVLAIIGYAFGSPSVNIISPLLANHMFGEKDFGTFMGLITLSISLGGTFGGVYVGMIYDITGSYTLGWLTMAVALLLAAIIRWYCANQNVRFDLRKVKQRDSEYNLT
ncbi:MULTISPECIES: MFS transporter [Paraliobacillus]|uniref:MFS transporter n=1 Tax=Paraliobacillus TaxID=200903 RepID=UPI000E3BEDCB|nr:MULTISPECIES: MFS transporter [Paraliobacillus]